jgi:hypothetical protein
MKTVISFSVALVPVLVLVLVTNYKYQAMKIGELVCEPLLKISLEGVYLNYLGPTITPFKIM